jgi:nucleoid-associated protein YgaU
VSLRVRLSRIAGETPHGVLSTPLYLPAVLGDFTVVEEASFEEYQTHRAGAFAAPAAGPATARQLRTVDLQALTIDWAASWATFTDPREVMNELNAVLRARRPCELFAITRWGDPSELRMNVNIRRLERTLRPGEADTRYWTLAISEWRNPKGGRRSTDPPRKDRFPKTAALASSTTLQDLARTFYGDETQWRLIGGANGLAEWGPRTAIIKSGLFRKGSKVTIPAPLSGP